MFVTKTNILDKIALAIPIFIVAIFFALPANAQTPDWTIDSFSSIITVQKDGSLLVSERIEVTFNVEKYGIFRKIPDVYKDKLNNRITIDIEPGEVFRDAQPELLKYYRQGSNKVIRLGDPNSTIAGKHIYDINYKVERAILFFDDFDELYWNVTGSDWEVPILNASAIVVLPDGTELLSTACYTGYYGSISTECEVDEKGSYALVTAEDFLTVAVSFPKGVVIEPTVQEKVLLFLKDNWFALIPIFFILIVFIIWFKVGRDPRLGKTVISEYEPPKDLLAVYAGLFVHPRITRQFVTAMIIQLAVMGYLSITVEGEEGKKKDTKITLTKEKLEDDLDPAHKKMMKILFGSKKKTTLAELKGTVTSEEIVSLHKKLYRKMQKDCYYTHSSFWMRTAMLVVGVVMLYAAVFLGFLFGVFTGVMLAIGGFVTIGFGFLMPQKTLKGAKIARQVHGFKLFMHTAERYRSKWQAKQNIFFEFLPYAIAFNDTQHWAEIFEGLQFKNPKWYNSSLVDIDYLRFSRNLNVVGNSIASSAIPRSTGSSGSSGGGFSGGGFGGGGGGSW